MFFAPCSYDFPFFAGDLLHWNSPSHTVPMSCSLSRTNPNGQWKAWKMLRGACAPFGGPILLWVMTGHLATKGFIYIYIYIIMYIYLFICFIVPLCLDSHIWSISLVYPVYPLGLDSPMTSDRWLVGGWPSPLKNIWVRQLGLLFPTEWKVIKFMFQTTNQYIYYICEMS